MHEHDSDLIAALAEGSLADDQAEKARALVDSCAECSQEFEAQHLALAAVADAPRPLMTGAERGELHRAINREATPARSPWYVRLAPALSAAAVLVLVVGIAGVMLRGSFGGDDMALVQQAESGAAATTAAPATTAGGVAEDAPAAAASPPLELAAVPPVQDLGKMSTADLEAFLSEAGAERALQFAAPQGAITEEAAGEDFERHTCVGEAAAYVAAELGIATFIAEVDEIPVEIYIFEDGTAIVMELPDCKLFLESPAP